MNDIVPLGPDELAGLDALEHEANKDSFEKLLKFVKGEYITKDGVIPHGTQFIAHCKWYTKCWVKFIKNQMIEKRLYRVFLKEVPPGRDTLDCQDKKEWEIGLGGTPRDPWILQSMLPFEPLVGEGEPLVFVSATKTGKPVVSSLVTLYKRHARDTGHINEMPVIELSVSSFTKAGIGKVILPLFKHVGWNDGAARDIKVETLKDEMDDEIPF